jgi:hypothetical protein
VTNCSWEVVGNAISGAFEQAPAIGVTTEVVVACKVGYTATICVYLWAFVAELAICVERLGRAQVAASSATGHALVKLTVL